MRTKRNPNNSTEAREISDEEISEMLEKIGALVKEKRSKMGSLEDISYQIRLSRSALTRHERGGDIQLGNFLKILFGLYIEPDEFFKLLKKETNKK